jgi:hypothetical protein
MGSCFWQTNDARRAAFAGRVLIGSPAPLVPCLFRVGVTHYDTFLVQSSCSSPPHNDFWLFFSYLFTYTMLQVARCTGIINYSKYVINVKQIARVIIWWTHITVFHEYMPISSKQFLVCKWWSVGIVVHEFYSLFWSCSLWWDWGIRSPQWILKRACMLGIYWIFLLVCEICRQMIIFACLLILADISSELPFSQMICVW